METKKPLYKRIKLAVIFSETLPEDPVLTGVFSGHITKTLQHIIDTDEKYSNVKEILDQEEKPTYYSVILLKCPDESFYTTIVQKAEEMGIPHHIATDDLGTFLENGKPVCVAIGPDLAERINKITGSFKAYK